MLDCGEGHFRPAVQLTLHADYSLRVLLYLAEHPGRPVSTQEMSEAYRISRHHLVRVVQTLSAHAFVKTAAGRNGGVTLMRSPAEIRLSDVVRKTEPGFRLVECFDEESNTCPIVGVCNLKGALAEALVSFFTVLDGYTLADIAHVPAHQLSALLQIEPGRRVK